MPSSWLSFGGHESLGWGASRKRTEVKRKLLICLAAVLIVGGLGSVATVLWGSLNGFFRFSLLETCLLCGAQQRTREIWAMDVRVLRSQTCGITGVTRALRKGKDCEHAFYFSREEVLVFSLRTDPHVIRRSKQAQTGSELFTHPHFLAALNSIAGQNEKRAEAIWSTTLRYSFHGNKKAMSALLDAAQSENPDTLIEFFNTSEYFRARRRSIAEIFEATR